MNIVPPLKDLKGRNGINNLLSTGDHRSEMTVTFLSSIYKTFKKLLNLYAISLSTTFQSMKCDITVINEFVDGQG